MASSHFKITLIDDYEFDEVASSLQKSVRRGLEYEACFWAFILHESGYYRYVWKRLLIIASEDVGNATPNSAIILNALLSNYQFAISATNRQKNDALVFIFQAVIYLSRATKNREVDNLVNLIRTKHDAGEKLEIPKFAIDFHTKKGRAKLGNWGDGTQEEIDYRHKIWFDEFSKVFPNDGKDEYIAELRKLKGADK